MRLSAVYCLFTVTWVRVFEQLFSGICFVCYLDTYIAGTDNNRTQSNFKTFGKTQRPSSCGDVK